MYAFSRTTSTLPRIRRTKVGMSDTPTATMTFVEPWPRTATTTRARRTLGKAIITSTTRMIRRSVQPPPAPLTRPSTSPPVRAMATAPSPVISESRAPVMTLLSTSRPYWSVPKG